MPVANPPTRGRELAQRLHAAIDEVRRAPQTGARTLPIITGLTPQCVFTEPLENVLVTATGILVASQKVFAKNDEIVYESVDGVERKLVPLSRGQDVERSAAAILSNLMVCEHFEPGRDPVQFPPPRNFVSVLLNCDSTLPALPRIKIYSTRPVFDQDFNLLPPGWHSDSGIMVHGLMVEPIFHPAPPPGLPVLDRLPPRLRELLQGFCFRATEDAVNAVAAMLTGLLASHFIATGKALVLIDGNQPGLGKTLIARVLGVLLDGLEPRLNHYTPDDEELAKRICATLRGQQTSVIVIDNAKLRGGGAISSPFLEANSMSPWVTLRILGQSTNINRVNDFVWVLTMNETKTSPDLVSRGMPIRLMHEGDPRLRNFSGGDPVAYVTKHRIELLGELCGMVLSWNQAGQPGGSQHHRCDYWARIIGGILAVAGLPEFLGNLDEAAASFNLALDELSALAEAAYAEGGRAIFEPDISDPETLAIDTRRQPKKRDRGLLASEWETLFRKGRVEVPGLDNAKSQQAKATVIGSFLSKNVDREVPVEVLGHPGRARLVPADAGRRQTRYSFSFTWEGNPPPPQARFVGGPHDPSGLPGREPRDPNRPRQSIRPGRDTGDLEPEEPE
jgi:hypothetical protein